MTGTLYIISAASGTGKTSLVNQLVQQIAHVKISVSYTTRHPRKTEKNGRDYFFVSQAKFDELIIRGEFLEYAHIFERSYATSKNLVEKDLQAGSDVILEIDWQGARQVREQLPEAVSIFILPPSKKALIDRITKRDQDHLEMIKKRLVAASEEISHYLEYDYLIVNDRFDEALLALRCIILSHRYRKSFQEKMLKPLLDELLDNKK